MRTTGAHSVDLVHVPGDARDLASPWIGAVTCKPLMSLQVWRSHTITTEKRRWLIPYRGEG
jgi:hypothetical protein